MAERTTVVNLRREPYDVYIGRAGKGQSGYFGNPFRVDFKRAKSDAEYAAAEIERYRSHFVARVAEDHEFRRSVLALRGKRLGCFCKPGLCHGDVIAEWVDSHTEHCHARLEWGDGECECGGRRG